MFLLAMMLFLWMPYLIGRLLRTAELARTVQPRSASSDTPGQYQQEWSALDDRELTRMLVDSAPQPTSEQDPA